MAALAGGPGAGRVCVCGDPSAGLGRCAGDHGAGRFLFFSALVAAELDRADDGTRAEQRDHVRGAAAALVRKGRLLLAVVSFGSDFDNVEKRAQKNRADCSARFGLTGACPAVINARSLLRRVRRGRDRCFPLQAQGEGQRRSSR